jgi:hypothetical protein
MAVLTADVLNHINANLGPNGAYNVVTAINQHSLSTPVNIDFDTKLEIFMGSIKEAQDFKLALVGSGTPALSTAAMNRLEYKLGGRGNAEAFLVAVNAGAA